MKTLFIALRAAIFGSGFIFLWGWVALGLHIGITEGGGTRLHFFSRRPRQASGYRTSGNPLLL
jgi:hypothetical protein